MTEAVTVTPAEDEACLIMEVGRKGTRGSQGGESGVPGLIKASGSRSSLRSVSPGFFDFLNKIFLSRTSLLH